MTIVITLTDSRSHGEYESIYSLLKNISKIDDELEMWVVDRADKKKLCFF